MRMAACDAVGQSASERRCQRSGGDEDAAAKADLVSEVEEREQVYDSRSKMSGGLRLAAGR